MIKLSDGRWCYSPRLPKEYEKAWVAQDNPDLATWNMIYLTYPMELDDLREGHSTVGMFKHVVKPEVTGTISGSVSHELKALNAEFGLRELATKPLPLFIHQLPSIEMRATPAAKLFDGRWVDRILANAKKIYEAHCDAADEVSIIDPALTNVIIGKFGK